MIDILFFIEAETQSWFLQILNSNLVGALLGAIIGGLFVIGIGALTLKKQDDQFKKQTEIQKRIALFDKRLEFANKILKEIDKIREFFIILNQGLPHLTKDDLEKWEGEIPIPSEYHDFFIKNYLYTPNTKYNSEEYTDHSIKSILNNKIFDKLRNKEINLGWGDYDIFFISFLRFKILDFESEDIERKSAVESFKQNPYKINTFKPTFYKLKFYHDNILKYAEWGVLSLTKSQKDVAGILKEDLQKT